MVVVHRFFVRVVTCPLLFAIGIARRLWTRITLELVKRSDHASGFVVLPLRAHWCWSRAWKDPRW
jgi:hypothetical protein